MWHRRCGECANLRCSRKCRWPDRCLGARRQRIAGRIQARGQTISRSHLDRSGRVRVRRFNRNLMFRGTFTALVTPFRKEDVDLAAFEKLIEAQIAAGIDGVVAVGTTGESPTLSHQEREQVIGTAVKVSKGRCNVLAGTGSNSTQHAVADTKAAEKLGVDSALLVAPYYNKPSQEGLFRHFQTIAQSTTLPIMLYNIPGRCGVDIGADTVVRLAEACPNIVSIKEASGSVERVSELRARLPDSFAIFSGDDSLTLPFMAAGAV